MPDWDEVYREQQVAAAQAASVLMAHEALLPEQGAALDYACGLGGNALLLAGKGLDTMALDQSEMAVQKLNSYAQQQGLPITAEQRDLENDPPGFSNAFDVIAVSYFLHRQTLPLLNQFLKPGGLLFYQTFSGQQRDGRGPSNPDFRLQRGELLKVFAQMELLAYREYPCEQAKLQTECDQVQFVARKSQ